MEAWEEVLSRGENFVTRHAAEMARKINARAVEWGWSKERRDQELVEQLGQVWRIWEQFSEQLQAQAIARWGQEARYFLSNRRAVKEAAQAVARADSLPVAAPAGLEVPAAAPAEPAGGRAAEEAAQAVASADSLPAAAPAEPTGGRAAEEAAQVVATTDSLPAAAPVEPADGQAAAAAEAMAGADLLPVAAPVELASRDEPEDAPANEDKLVVHAGGPDGDQLRLWRRRRKRWRERTCCQWPPQWASGWQNRRCHPLSQCKV